MLSVVVADELDVAESEVVPGSDGEEGEGADDVGAGADTVPAVASSLMIIQSENLITMRIYNRYGSKNELRIQVHDMHGG